MGEWILRTTNVSKKYGAVYALQKVNVEIKRGQIYGMIGLNGAGKTTFMRLIMGLIAPTDGVVELFGRSGGAALREGRARIGQFIETPAIYPNMTVAQNIEVQRILGGVSDKGNVHRVLSLVGLSDMGKKKARHLSFGMKQRLALAIALVTNPEFLVLDEPANGLDPKGIVEIRELIARLAKEYGMTLLVSSHLLDELAQTATHYGIIDKGRLVRQLSAGELARESRQYIHIVSRQARQAGDLLKGQFGIADLEVISPMEMKIFEQLEKVSEINAFLVRSHIDVEGIGVSKQKLEDYFIGLVGGRLQ